MRIQLKTAPAIFASIIILSGCGVLGKSESTNERQETTIKVMEHTKLVPVLTSYDIPDVRERRTTRDSSSHLENDYAVSDAVIRGDGTLYHSLDTKPRSIPVETEVKVEWRDSVVYRDREVERTISVPVERKISWWQRVRLDGFWILLALVVFAYRKEIFALVTKVLV